MNTQRGATTSKSDRRRQGNVKKERKKEGGKADQLADDQDGGQCIGKQKYVKETCPVCKIQVCDSERALECNLREMWHHAACENINEAVYKFLVENQASAIHWYCFRCNNVMG